jgi:hypothetical protein
MNMMIRSETKGVQTTWVRFKNGRAFSNGKMNQKWWGKWNIKKRINNAVKWVWLKIRNTPR